MNRLDFVLNELKLHPEEPLNHYLVAIEFRSMGREDHSILLFQKLIIDFPSYLPTYYTLAELLFKIGEDIKAEAYANNGKIEAEKVNNLRLINELNQLIELNN